MKVSQVMNKNPLWVAPDASFGKCWQIIFQKKVHSLPVIDDKKKLLGIISEADLLKKIYPDYKDFYSNTVSSMQYQEIESNIKKLSYLKAEKLMNKGVISTDLGSIIYKALSKMIINRVNQLPVVDKRNRLVGFITKGDIFDAIYKTQVSLARRIVGKVKSLRKKK